MVKYRNFSTKPIPLKERFLRISTRSLLLLLLQCGGLGLAYLLHLLLVRFLGVDEYGRLSIVFSLTGVLGVLSSFGLPTASMRFVSEYRHSDAADKLRGLYLGGASLSVGTAFFLGSLCLVSLEFTNLLAGRVPIWELGLGLLLFLPLSNFSAWEFHWARAHQKVVVPGILQHLAGPIVLILGIVAFKEQDWTLNAAVVLLLMTCINLSETFFLKRDAKNLPYWLSDFRPKFEWGYWFKIGSPMMLTGFFMVVMAQVDVLLLGWLCGAYEAGIYAVDFKIAGLVSLVITAINTLAAPMYAELYAGGEIAVCQSLARQLSLPIFFPSLVLAIGLVIFGENVLGFFGSDFVNSYPVLLILILGHLMNAATGSVGQLCDLTGLQRPAMVIRGFCACLNLGLSFWFIRLWGLAGAAGSTAFCLALWNLMLYLLVRSYRDIRPAVWDGLANRRCR